MRKIGFIIIASIFLGACANQAEKKQDQNEVSEQEIVSLSVDEFMASPESYLDKEISLTGLVTHVCKHGGQKLFVTGTTEGVALRINTSENIPEFSIDMEGTEAEFTGTVMLMTEEFAAEAEAEHMEHHPEEAVAEGGTAVEKAETGSGEKTYYLVAKSFKTL